MILKEVLIQVIGNSATSTEISLRISLLRNICYIVRSDSTNNIYKEMTGNAFIWRTKQFVAVTEMEQGRLVEAKTRMENVLADMRKHYGS